jgi:hypothetical protein
VRVDPALVQAFGRPGCAQPSSIADPLHAASAQAVADLQAAVAQRFGAQRQAAAQEVEGDRLLLAVALSPRPSSAQAQGSPRGSLGRCRS